MGRIQDRIRLGTYRWYDQDQSVKKFWIWTLNWMVMISGLYGKEEKPSAKSGLSSAAGGMLLL